MNRTPRRVWRKKLWKSRTPRFPLLTASLADAAAALVLLAVVELVGSLALGVADLALGDVDVDLLALLGLLLRDLAFRAGLRRTLGDLDARRGCAGLRDSRAIGGAFAGRSDGARSAHRPCADGDCVAHSCRAR